MVRLEEGIIPPSQCTVNPLTIPCMTAVYMNTTPPVITFGGPNIYTVAWDTPGV